MFKPDKKAKVNPKPERIQYNNKIRADLIRGIQRIAFERTQSTGKKVDQRIIIEAALEEYLARHEKKPK